MRFTIVFCLLFVAENCAEKAMGIAPQILLGPSALWLWWLPTASFALNGVYIAFRGVTA